MARPKKTSGEGHNSVILADDDAAALQLHYTLRIRAQRASVDEVKAKLDAERDELNGLFSMVRGELRINRKEFEEVLALQDLGESEFLAHEKKRQQRLANQGLPVGSQLDMFASTGDTVDDQRVAYLDGLRAGRRGDFGTPPDRIATFLHTNWQEGWNDGVAENAPKLLRAAEILKQREQANNTDIGDDDSDRDEEEPDPLDPDVIKAEARKVKNSGFMERGEPELDTVAAE